MNRREALAALVALPATTRISVAQLKPDDVIVIECDQVMSMDEMARIRQMTRNVWPQRPCVVLGAGMRMKVVGK